ncbi:hypothetical protein QBC47DRAFT_314913 [Echria macrotheca]|uniref:G domain-containing protein n=1 Tax=Echria macrotheca TaxID=438768 RepID=A0AAJ0F8D0_9PEZI|nr:hypothetical protein QBC47DRAFT_314913 [Echria macrotheca]
MAPQTPIVAVIGTTGSGKSSFIRGITGSEDCKVGHTLLSETTCVKTYTLKTPSGDIELADTPGFDDTRRTDYEVLEELVSWLRRTWDGGRTLTAILYLHPIDHERLRGSSRKMMRMVQKLLGPKCFGMVMLVTSFWNQVDAETGAAREKELLESEDGWKPFRDEGATVERMARDYHKFVPILERMVIAKPAGMRMRAQDELETGGELSQTMAAMSLNDESAEQSQRLNEAMEKAKAHQAEQRKRVVAARRAREEKQKRKLLATLAQQKEESLRVKELLEQQERSHQERMRQTQKNIEEQKRKEASLRAKLEQERVEAERRDRDRAITALQSQASIQFQASEIQQQRVSGMVQSLRIFLTTTGYPQPVWGINPVGRGMSGVGRFGQVLQDYRGIQPSGMTVWCDCCRVAIGQSVSYVCYSCDARICAKCYGQGRGCLNRSHLLIEDHYWRCRQASNCRRLRWPDMQLWCDSPGCRKPIGGLYLHCCCAEMDFCEACVLSRNVRCTNNRHMLYWGVRPLLLDTASSDASLVSQGLKHPQTVVQVSEQTMRTWLDTSTRPPALSTSVSRQKALRQQTQRLQEAINCGDITTRLDINVPFCDYCLAPIRAKPHYGCLDEHPETGLVDTNIALCQPCYLRGIRCPSHHALRQYAATYTSCQRILSPDAQLTCDACRKTMMQEAYFHCCRHGDDFDICVDCVLDGWSCQNETGDHVLIMFHLVD